MNLFLIKVWFVLYFNISIHSFSHIGIFQFKKKCSDAAKFENFRMFSCNFKIDSKFRQNASIINFFFSFFTGR